MKNLIQKSIAKREVLIEDSFTDSFRLVDGAGDQLPDVYLDQLGDNWLLSTKDGLISEELREALLSFQKTIYWKKLDQHDKQSPSLLGGQEVEDQFLVMENALRYELSFQSGYSQGIFLDQRENRQRVKEWVSSGDKILNTFAYTGPFSIAAASAGAVTTTLDLSQTYLDWAKRNMQPNGFSPEDHYFCKGDTFHWLTRFGKSGRTFEGVILDPPTFSRDQKGKPFKVEKDYHKLIKLSKSLLSQKGWILACTNCKKLPEWQFEEQILKGLGEDASNYELQSYEMPFEYSEEPYLKTYKISKRP